jgi:hypothetical protein
MDEHREMNYLKEKLQVCLEKIEKFEEKQFLDTLDRKKQDKRIMYLENELAGKHPNFLSRNSGSNNDSMVILDHSYHNKALSDRDEFSSKAKSLNFNPGFSPPNNQAMKKFLERTKKMEETRERGMRRKELERQLVAQENRDQLVQNLSEKTRNLKVALGVNKLE